MAEYDAPWIHQELSKYNEKYKSTSYFSEKTHK